MNTELRKRLDRAADGYENKIYNGITQDASPCARITDKDSFLAGAEYGYKEAIELAKEWLAVKGVFDGKTCGDLKQYITDFETTMNKRWEE